MGALGEGLGEGFRDLPNRLMMNKNSFAKNVFALGLMAALAVVAGGCHCCGQAVGPPMWRNLGRCSWMFHVPVETSPSYGYYPTRWRSWPTCDDGELQRGPDALPSEPRDYASPAEPPAVPHVAPPQDSSAPARSESGPPVGQ